ncbi:MAG: DUF2961 domain-containing protein [Spirochaetaceae bacterium]
MFKPLQHSLSTLSLLTDAQSRSICGENRTGEIAGGAREHCPQDDNGNPIGDARELGQGWKVHPSDIIPPGEVFELANIEGPGCINHIWMVPTGRYRSSILRVYYDGNDFPSIEVPVGDFFASAYTSVEDFAQVNSLPVCVNPGSAFNCYWPIPFKKNLRMTLENRDYEDVVLYYQIDYTLQTLPENTAYFHAQFRRINPLPYGDVYTILDGVEGQGHYVGTYMAWQVNNNIWWGEGEIKFYIDGDANPEISGGKIVAGSTGFPTICGTGTEDYFCGSYNYENQRENKYQEYSTPYAGVPHIVRPDGLYKANQRFSMYRWHLPDPIHFKKNLKITIQALGWRKNRKHLQLQDDISSVAFWYQTLPSRQFPKLPNDDYLEII